MVSSDGCSGEKTLLIYVELIMHPTGLVFKQGNSLSDNDDNGIGEKLSL